VQAIVAELRAESRALDDLVAGLTEQQWRAPTPAVGWDVRDTVSHLAGTDEIALDCLTGRGEEQLAAFAAYPTPEAATQAMADRGKGRSGADVLAWWRTARDGLADALEAADPAQRVPWFAGAMAPRSFATARLMETWAHGLDCFAAVGATPVDTDRLRHVCHIGFRALPYAFRYAGAEPSAPLTDLRLELTGPQGQVWTFGDPAAPQSVTGAAGEWARVAVQRLPATAARTLRADGRLAEQALLVARAYV
jgi:uncharacterized protein (TIGR03084 family)